MLSTPAGSSALDKKLRVFEAMTGKCCNCGHLVSVHRQTLGNAGGRPYRCIIVDCYCQNVGTFEKWNPGEP